MKVQNYKIVEATENELFGIWLDRGLDDVMSFTDYKERCTRLGTRIIEDKDGNKMSYVTYSEKEDFSEFINKLLLYRKIVEAVQVDDREVHLKLDNGIYLKMLGNEGCGGCCNGWFYVVDGVNTCDNVITKVETQ